MKILVSACLLGANCKYNGGNNYSPKLAAFLADKEVLPVCPECLAGLPTPRTPMEIVDGVLTDRDGNVHQQAMEQAVAAILQNLKGEEIQCAILQPRSPSCGVRQVYDGSFTGRLVPGSGVFAQALKQAGYRVLEEDDLL